MFNNPPTLLVLSTTWGMGNHLLQESCSNAVTEIGNPIEQEALLVKVLPELFTHQISHPGGARSSQGHAAKLPLSIDLVSSEAQIPFEQVGH